MRLHWRKCMFSLQWVSIANSLFVGVGSPCPLPFSWCWDLIWLEHVQSLCMPPQTLLIYMYWFSPVVSESYPSPPALAIFIPPPLHRFLSLERRDLMMSPLGVSTVSLSYSVHCPIVGPHKFSSTTRRSSSDEGWARYWSMGIAICH